MRRKGAAACSLAVRRCHDTTQVVKAVRFYSCGDTPCGPECPIGTLGHRPHAVRSSAYTVNAAHSKAAAACSGVARAVAHGDALIRKGIAAVGEVASTCYTIRTRGGSL